MEEMENKPEGAPKSTCPCERKGRSRFEGVSEVLTSWETKGYATVPIEIPPQQIKRSVESFIAFTQLPETLREKICTYIPGNEKRVVLGTGIRKPENDSDGKHKDFFHYHPDVLRECEHDILQAGPDAIAFLTEADKIWKKVAEQVEGLLKNEINPAYYPQYQNLLKRFIPEGKTLPQVTLRFLAYKKTKRGDYSAKAHYDRGTMTLAIAESAPGLWIENKEKKREAVHHEEGQAIFFPGISFNHCVDPRIKATLHGVSQNEENNYTDDIARWALVAFIDIPGAPTPPKDKTVDL